MATSGTHTMRAGWWWDDNIYVDFVWWRNSYDSYANCTNIGYYIEIWMNQGGTGRGDETVSWRIGDTHFSHVANVSLSGNERKRIYEGTHNIYHNADGTIGGTLFGLWGNIIGMNWTAVSDPNNRGSGPWTYVETYFYLDRIPRPATLDSATDFTDESNPTITYSNPGGNNVNFVRACISADGTYPLIAYRDVGKTDGTYTFNLTDAERKTLRSHTTGTSKTFYFLFTCDDAGFITTGSIARTMTLVNYSPTLSPTVRDADTYINSLTGSDQKFILGYSDVYFDTGASAKKEASIDYQWIRCGSITLDDYTQNTGTIENIDSGTVYFEMKDSRGFVVRDAKVLSVIPYIKLTASVETGPFNANGTVTFTLKGLYFDDTFGNEHNSMQVQYSLRDEDGNFAQVDGVRESGWVELGQVQPNTASGTYEFSHTITGLDYEKTWELTVAVQDALTPLQTVTTVVAPLPVFDWSGKDFHHHTDVILSEGMSIYLGNVEFSSDNKILWSGASHMNGSQTAYLSDNVSNQPNGIVLVFSLYRDGAAANASFNTHFVSKKEIELFSGNAHTFMMGINSGFSKIGAKYLSIYDDHLTGNDTNTATGTNSGITFDNAGFVLRAVIGV